MVSPTDGKDVALTIDQDVQWYTQRVLRDTVLQGGRPVGVGLVMDVRTGGAAERGRLPDVRRQPARPSRRKSDLGSRALRDVDEPGSVEKVLTLSSLIDEGKVTARTRVVVPWESLKSSDRTIGDWFDHGKDPADHGRRDRAQLQHRHGDGCRGVHPRAAAVLPRACSGSAAARTSACPVRPGACCRRPEPGRTLSLAQIAFGQGLSVNALQMAHGRQRAGQRGRAWSRRAWSGAAPPPRPGNEVGTETTTPATGSERASRSA